MSRAHNTSTTPEQMAGLVEKHAEQIRRENLSRYAVQDLTGLGESASRRLLALVWGGTAGKRVTMPGTRKERGAGKIPAPQPAPAPAEEPEQIKVDTRADRQTIEAPKTRIGSPDELLRRAGVDLTEWEVERAVVSNWEMGSAPRRTGNDKDGWSRPSDDVKVTPLYSVKVYLKRRHDTQVLKDLKADVLAEIRAAAGAVNSLARRPRVKRDAGQLLYMGAHDVHVGKLALPSETLTEYSSEHARTLALSSIRKLLDDAGGHGIARIVLPIGHDLAHFESGLNTTTRGTPQDPDGRYRLMRRFGRDLAAEMIQACLDVAPVDVLGVPGNHGYDTDISIAEWAEARFHGHAHVRVQVPLTPRAYYRYGVTLLGLTHGDGMKPAALPLTMADEMPEAWAQTQHREWLLGHFHAKATYQVAQTETETRGVRVRVLPSISGTDWWHAVSGYRNVRAMEAYRYSHADGYVGHHSTTVKAARGLDGSVGPGGTL